MTCWPKRVTPGSYHSRVVPDAMFRSVARPFFHSAIAVRPSSPRPDIVIPASLKSKAADLATADGVLQHDDLLVAEHNPFR